MTTLTPAQIESALRTVPAWAKHGDTIVRTFVFPDYAAGVRFVDRVAALADEAWHHPDINIRYKAVTIVLTTHDAGGLTELDFALAARIDTIG